MVCGSALNLAVAQSTAPNPETHVIESQILATNTAHGELPTSMATSDSSTSFKEIEGDVPLPSLDQDIGETRSRHAARINRNIAFISGSILAVFIVCRLLLLQQLTKRRRKIAREQHSLEG